jgi:hypothetical protein
MPGTMANTRVPYINQRLTTSLNNAAGEKPNKSEATTSKMKNKAMISLGKPMFS